jgi:hypothetical protein
MARPIRFLLPLLAVIGATSLVGCGTSSPSGVGSAALSGGGPNIQLSSGDAYKIGRRVWKNECGGTVEGLTSWNKGEAFASLGIGHFIWYPAGRKGPYEESFPGLMQHLQATGVQIPGWLQKAGPCPWPNKATFDAARQSPQMEELRTMLAGSVPQQASFLANRFLTGTRKIIAAASPAEQGLIQQHIEALAATPSGLYAMMDYVNFKGEGINPAERYQGTGWGLLQVLQGMQGTPSGQSAAQEFSRSAKATLARRVELAPKKEGQWLAGWHNRCDSYAAPF